MDIFRYILTNLINGFIGIILLVLGYKIFDICTPKFHFAEMFDRKYVSNGSIVVAAFIIGLAIIIGLTAG